MIGRKWFFKTVTYHFTGEVTNIINGKFLVLKNAAWIVDSGRFSNAILKGTLDEVEPVKDWIVNLDTVTDFGEWNFDLPMDQK
jgi:hypothetical protein